MKPENLNHKKCADIARVISNRPVEWMWGMDPDANTAAKFKDKNIWTRAKYTIIGTVLFALPAAYTLRNNNSIQTRIMVENVLTPPPDVYSRDCVSAIIALLGLTGAGAGCLLAGYTNARRMSRATINNRAQQILALLEILKSRPWTPAEEDELDKLIQFTSRGLPVKWPTAVRPTLLIKISELDSGYIASLRNGNLSAAPKWVSTAIRVGGYNHRAR